MCGYVGFKGLGWGRGGGANSLWETGQLIFNMGPESSEVRTLN
jgi:hypothetical protein